MLPSVTQSWAGSVGRPVAVCAQAREAEVREAALARAEQLALAAQLEVPLRELEAVRRVDERLQARLRGVRQLLLRTRDQEAVALFRAAADAAAQLVELR